MFLAIIALFSAFLWLCHYFPIHSVVLWLCVTAIGALLAFLVARTYVSREISQKERINAEQRYRKLFEKASESIVVTKNGRIILLNPRASELWGYKSEELLNRPIHDFVHPDDRDAMLQNYKNLWDDQNECCEYTAEIQIVSSDNREKWVETHATCIDWDDEKAVLHFVIEITRRKNFEQELKTINKQLKELSIRDSLTNLYNRRHMTDVLKKEFERARRYRHDLSCLLFDLDFFKEINDTLGHSFGDVILQEFAQLLTKNTRNPDFIFRYGGEEFLILLPNTNCEGALTVAEKIRANWEKHTYSDESGSASLTVSVGVASRNKHQPKDWQALITFADRALYSAKAEGRNRVKAYREDEIQLHLDSEKSRNLKYLKERLAVILDKTKRGSVESIELLVRDLGGTKYRKHAQQVNEYLELMGEKLNLPPDVLTTFKRASTIHNCFKILLDSTVSKDGQLSEEEWGAIEAHPYVLAELTELFDFFVNERSILLFHRERYDGSGYPEGLFAQEIPLGARIFAIADAVVAMSSDRPHRKRLPMEKIVRELAENAGTQFDPDMVALFLDMVEENKIPGIPPEVVTEARGKLKKIMES